MRWVALLMPNKVCKTGSSMRFAIAGGREAWEDLAEVRFRDVLCHTPQLTPCLRLWWRWQSSASRPETFDSPDWAASRLGASHPCRGAAATFASFVSAFICCRQLCAMQPGLCVSRTPGSWARAFNATPC